MGESRVLTQRELNRALLARQLLLDRTETSIPKALERMAGLQAQYAPAMYLGLWSRMADLNRDDVTTALEKRTAIQGTLLRSTIHLVSKADYWPFALAIRTSRRNWYTRVARPKVDSADIAAAAATLRAALEDGPKSRAEIDKLLGPGTLAAAGMWLDLVRVPPSGTWERRRADLYQTAENWVGPQTGSPQHGLELLVRRYLGGFGPATRNDVATWAGLTAGELEPALDRLTLRTYRAEDGAELLDLPDAPLPEAQTPAPVRFLPVWDATLLVHARRTQILPERYRPRLFSTKTPHSFNSFLVDGAVAGTWRYEHKRITLEPFHPLTKRVRAELDDEADRLAAFHG